MHSTLRRFADHLVAATMKRMEQLKEAAKGLLPSPVVVWRMLLLRCRPSSPPFAMVEQNLPENGHDPDVMQFVDRCGSMRQEKIEFEDRKAQGMAEHRDRQRRDRERDRHEAERRHGASERGRGDAWRHEPASARLRGHDERQHHDSR